MKKILIVAICLCGVFTHAQEMDTTANKIKWVNLVQIGQMFSNHDGVSGLLSGSWTSGVQRGRLITGVELGFNDYEIFNLGSAALYGKYILRKIDRSPYGYGLIGYGLPLYHKNHQILDTSSIKGGLIYGLGIGMDFPMDKVTFLVQLGYKFQKTSYDQPAYYYSYNIDMFSNFAPYGGSKNTTRKMHRIEFKIGLQF